MMKNTMGLVAVFGAIAVGLGITAFGLVNRPREPWDDLRPLLRDDPNRVPVALKPPVQRGYPESHPDRGQPSLILRFSRGKFVSESSEIEPEVLVPGINELLTARKTNHIIFVIAHDTQARAAVPVIEKLRDSKARLIAVSREW